MSDEGSRKPFTIYYIGKDANSILFGFGKEYTKSLSSVIIYYFVDKEEVVPKQLLNLNDHHTHASMSIHTMP